MDELSNAAASVWIDAQPDDVWIALTESSRLRRWLGAELRSDWRRGSPLVWDGDEGGEVLEAAPGLGLALRRGERGLGGLPAATAGPPSR